MVTATLDTHLRIPVDSLPEDVLEQIAAELTFENREREAAKREKRYGWTQMPTHINLWELKGDQFIMPRGFVQQFMDGMDELGENWSINDQRTGERDDFIVPPFPHYRPHQPPAVEAILDFQSGIYEAPPGSGKTVSVLEVVRRAQMKRNIIVVNRIELADQWLDRARSFLGPDFPVGVIGDGEWNEQRLTVATVQTLYAKLEQLKRDRWFSRWGLSCLDEMHHQTAQSYIDVMSAFSSYYRFGVSATPDKTGDFEYALAVLGDIIHRTTRHELRESGVLVRPTIKVVHTSFDFPFHSTFTHKHPRIPCSVCGKKSKHTHRNNYQDMLKALKEDTQRNATIAKCISMEADHRMLVTSSQKSHLELLAGVTQNLYPDLPDFYMLSGKESRKERQWVIDAVKDGPCVVFSTIADEALDIPVLDRELMAWPTKNIGSVRQRLGRIERAALEEGKTDAVAYDIADTSQGVLAKQFGERRWGIYASDLYKVENHDAEELLHG